MSRGGKFKKDKQDIAKNFKCDIQIIQRIWKDAMQQIAQGLEVNVACKKKGRCGRKPLDIDLSIIPTIPLNKRSTIRSLAWQLKVNPSTLYTKYQANQIRRHTSSLNPALTEKHKKTRVQFCLGMVDETTTRNGDHLFNDMHRILHVDEKWFYMTQDNKNYYLLPDEPDPIRAIPKNCIGKVMFIAAVARPRNDSEGNMTCDGKIGIWPFVKEVPAQRRSDNKPKGTLEIKPIIVKRDVMREYFIKKLLPAIQALWPEEDAGKTIFIQQDNVTPHILPNDPAFMAAVANTGLKIQLM